MVGQRYILYFDLACLILSTLDFAQKYAYFPSIHPKQRQIKASYQCSADEK